jgi:hypothetical protein
MPMPQDFLGDVLGFMNQNVVVVSFTTDAAASKLTLFLDMKLTSATDEEQRAVDKKGNAIGLYYLDAAPVNDPERFNAFWCPGLNNWSGGSGVFLNPARAVVMFTDTMSGCSLGVGSKTQAGCRQVMHLNQEQAARDAVPGTDLDKIMKMQQKLQRELLVQQGLTCKIVEPSAYGGKMTPTGLKYRCTTFGAWDTTKGDWRFYMQRYSRQGGFPVTYTHAGCKKA